MPAYAYEGETLERRGQGAAAQARRAKRVRVRAGGGFCEPAGAAETVRG